MKGKTLKYSMLSALIFMVAIPALAQNGRGENYSTSADSLKCGMNLSAYRSFFRLKLYNDAYFTWFEAFSNCPSSSERMYIDGVIMYRSFIDAAPEGPVREQRIDSLMLIYDRRMEYFGNEGNVLGRKAKDLLTYRGAEIEHVEIAYEMLKKSVELQGKKSRDVSLLLFVSSGITLNKEGKLDNNQLIENYIQVSGILDQLEGTSSRWDKARATIDELMLKEDILSCERLNQYYEPQFEQNKNDQAWLKEAIALYTKSVCERSDIYLAASESLYSLEPGPESAHNLAILLTARKENEKAAGYLQEAVQGENIDKNTRALWYYELAVLTNARKEHCKAIEYAREAIALKSDYGKAWILLGDAFIASRKNLGNDFEQRTAFWAAADMYQKASEVDPSLADESTKKLNKYLGQFPHKEDIFFHDLKEGYPYVVGGCINESTTVKSRQ